MRFFSFGALDTTNSVSVGFYVMASAMSGSRFVSYLGGVFFRL